MWIIHRVSNRYQIMSFVGHWVPNKKGTGPRRFRTKNGAKRHIKKMQHSLGITIADIEKKNWVKKS